MAGTHWQFFVTGCPDAQVVVDATVKEKREVTCLACLEMLVAGGSLADAEHGEQENEYLQGYDDGREAAYAEIAVYLDGRGHHDACVCDPCRVVRAVWQKSLSKALQLRLDEWIRVNRN